MKVINTVRYIELTGTEPKTLYDAYNILDELYGIIEENDYEQASNTLTDESYNKHDIALAANILRTFASTNKLEITE